MVRRLRGIGGLAGAAGIVMMLASGCASVPDTGAVHAAGAPVSGDGTALDHGYVPVLPPSPQPDFTADDIVAGFREAMTDFTDGHRAARRFLSAGLAQRWDADAQTIVYSSLTNDNEVLDPTDEDAPHVYTFDVTPVAIVDRDHGFHLASGKMHWKVTVTRQPRGVWRVSGVGPGTLLSEAEFNRAFRGVDVYYPAAAGGRPLVPDHVFLPASPDTLPGAVVGQLVDGPTRWLSPVVRPVVPPGTTVRGVSMDAEGAVTVDLAGSAPIPAGDARDLLAAATWSLTGQISDVKTVTIRYNGAVIGGPTTEQNVGAFDPDAYQSGAPATFVAHDHVVQLPTAPRDPAPAPQQQPALPGLADPVSPSVANGLAAIQHQATTDALVLFDGSRWRPVYSARHLSAPTWLPDGSAVFVAARAANGTQQLVSVEVATGNGTAYRPVTVPIDLRGSGLRALGPITGLRISRDGTRVAFVAGDAHSGGRAYVARIAQRDGGWIVSGVRQLVRQCTSDTATRCISDALDLAWADAEHVVVLGSSPQGDPKARTPYEVSVDGSSVQPIVVPNMPSNASSISAAPGQPLAVVVPATGKGGQDTIYVDAGGSWQTAANGSGVHYPD